MSPNTRGLVSAPVKLQSEEVKRLVEDDLWTQGVRGKLDANKRRHDFQIQIMVFEYSRPVANYQMLTLFT